MPPLALNESGQRFSVCLVLHRVPQHARPLGSRPLAYFTRIRCGAEGNDTCCTYLIDPIWLCSLRRSSARSGDAAFIDYPRMHSSPRPTERRWLDNMDRSQPSRSKSRAEAVSCNAATHQKRRRSPVPSRPLVRRWPCQYLDLAPPPPIYPSVSFRGQPSGKSAPSAKRNAPNSHSAESNLNRARRNKIDTKANDPLRWSCRAPVATGHLFGTCR